MAVNPPSSTEDISYCHNDADWDRQHKEAREAKRDWTEGDVMLRRRRLQWMEALKGDEMKVNASDGSTKITRNRGKPSRVYNETLSTRGHFLH